jgi:hypothetical protein
MKTAEEREDKKNDEMRGVKKKGRLLEMLGWPELSYQPS